MTKKTNHYVYKTILEGSDKYYIGRRSSKKEPMDDKYMGSGRWVQSIKDKSRLSKVILEVCDTFDDLCIAEEKWITEYFEDINNMNILYSSTGAASGELAQFYGKKHSNETRQKMSESRSGDKNPMYGRTGKLNPMYGKKHSEETLKKMSEVQSGEKSNTAKLTEFQVLEIRKMYNTQNHTQNELGIQFGVTSGNICRVITRRIWKHI